MKKAATYSVVNSAIELDEDGEPLFQRDIT